MDFFQKVKSQYDIILASQSPRRKALMEQTGIPFRVLSRPVPESFPDEMSPDKVVLFLCHEKSRGFETELKKKNVTVITADTIVVDRDMILNKPADGEEAFQMLTRLSGKGHDVLTGVCIRHQKQTVLFFEKTRVYFRPLQKEEILYYIDHYKPLDKAGAYGIQEWIGQVGIRKIEGSYLNVVGLPVERVYRELRKLLG